MALSRTGELAPVQPAGPAECRRPRAQEGTAFFPGSSLAGEGLLVSDGPTWRRQRQLANPAFRRAAVNSYAAARPRPGRSPLV